MKRTKSNGEIGIFLQKNMKHVANALSQLSEQELESFFISKDMDVLIERIKSNGDFSAFDDFFDFYYMFYRFYAKSGSWTANHNNWREYYLKCKIESQG